jgi:hypothetical protein
MPKETTNALCQFRDVHYGVSKLLLLLGAIGGDAIERLSKTNLP